MRVYLDMDSRPFFILFSVQETETMVSDVKSGGGTESKEKGKGGEMPLKPTPHLWRQRIGRFPALSKWILAAVTAFLALLVIIITITAFRASRGIDIAPLIIDGKYINTITSCGPIQGYVVWILFNKTNGKIVSEGELVNDCP